jgi:hypothetical protein
MLLMIFFPGLEFQFLALPEISDVLHFYNNIVARFIRLSKRLDKPIGLH